MDKLITLGNLDTFKEQLANNISNPNLLLNPDFSVNSRGVYSWSSASGEEILPHWVHNGGNIVQNSDNSLTLTCTGGIQGIRQNIDQPGRLAGKTVTLSVEGFIDSTAGYALYVNLYYTIGSTASVTVCNVVINSTSKTVVASSGMIPSELTDDDSLFIDVFQANSSKICTINWVKLEIGSLSTAFTPPTNPPTRTVAFGCKSGLTLSHGHTNAQVAWTRIAYKLVWLRISGTIAGTGQWSWGTISEIEDITGLRFAKKPNSIYFIRAGFSNTNYVGYRPAGRWNPAGWDWGMGRYYTTDGAYGAWADNSSGTFEVEWIVPEA